MMTMIPILMTIILTQVMILIEIHIKSEYILSISVGLFEKQGTAGGIASGHSVYTINLVKPFVATRVSMTTTTSICISFCATTPVVQGQHMFERVENVAWTRSSGWS